MNSALAQSFSPRLSTPLAQVVLWDSQRAAFRLHADNGGDLKSLLDESDVGGRYLEVENKLSLDSNVHVTTDTKYSAYVREDGLNSILWFEAPSTGTNQFSASGALVTPNKRQATSACCVALTCRPCAHAVLPRQIEEGMAPRCAPVIECAGAVVVRSLDKSARGLFVTVDVLCVAVAVEDRCVDVCAGLGGDSRRRAEAGGKETRGISGRATGAGRAGGCVAAGEHV